MMTAAMAIAGAIPVLSREGRNEPHMKVIPKKGAPLHQLKSRYLQRICPEFPQMVNRVGPKRLTSSGNCARIATAAQLTPVGHWPIGKTEFPKLRQKLANAGISCCNPSRNRIWPFDCAFRDLEI
jgi:hypothetical protein